MTSLAGLPVYLDLASVLGLGDHIRAHMHVRQSQGWKDEQVILSLVLLNLAGGESVDDIRILAKDEGFCKVLGRVETKELTRQRRRAQERRWRKEHRTFVPSQSAIFRYLAAFHDSEEEKKAHEGQSLHPCTKRARAGADESKPGLRRLHPEAPREDGGHSRYGCHPRRNPERRRPVLLQRI